MFATSFESLCRSDPDALAVYDADESETWSRAQLAKRVDRIEAELAGITGNLVAISLPNGAGFVSAVLATWRLGRTVVPLDADWTRNETVRICERFGANILIDRNGIHSLVGGGEAPASSAVVKVTSGTTGEPRGIVLEAEALATGVSQIASTMGLRGEDRTLVTIPLSHSYAFDSALLMLCTLGCPLVITRDLTPTRFAKVVKESEASVWPGIPFLLDVMARARGARADSLGNLRLVISAGAPLPVETRESFAARFGRRPQSFYGSSECGGITFDREGTESLPDGCVGAPLAGVRLELEETAGEGNEGRVRVISSSVGKAYFPDPSAELDGKSFLTGDIGRIDSSGRLVLLGRASEVINIGARKVYPAEVERVLRSVPGVTDAAAMGGEREMASESLRALVVAREGTSVATLRRACEEALPAWKVPKRIEIRAALPRTARGKLDRRRL